MKCKRCKCDCYKWNVMINNLEEDKINSDFGMCHDCLNLMMKWLNKDQKKYIFSKDSKYTKL